MKSRFSRPLALGLAAVLTACGGAEERKAEHLSKALDYFAANNAEKADVEFRRVLQIDPNTAKPYFYLGRLEEQKQNWGQAFGFYQKAVELDPNDTDARFKLAQFLALSKQPDQALEHLAAVEKAKPGDLDVRLLKAAISSQKGDVAGATAILETLVAERPAKAEPYLVLAALYSQNRQMDRAQASLDAGLAANPGSPPLLTGLARFHEQQKQWGEAEKALRDLIAAEPRQLGHRALLADAQFRQEHWPELETTLRDAVRDFPDDPKAILLLADSFARRGQDERALAELRTGIAAIPNSLELVSAEAGLLEKTGQRQPAEQAYRDFIARNETSPEAVKARVQLAQLLSRQGRMTDSEALVDQVLKDSPQDFEALMLKGKLALARKNPQDAIGAFRSVLKDQPDSVEALSLLADAFQLDGKPALARENLEKAVLVKPGDIVPRRNLVQFLVQQNQVPEALAQAQDFLKRQPGSLDGMNLEADVLAISKQSDALEALLKEIKAKFPDQPLGAYRLGSFHQVRKDYPAALAEYEQALALAPNDYEVLKAYVSACLETGNPGRAEARLRKSLAVEGRAGTWQLLGALALSQGRSAEGTRALEQAIAANPRWLLPYAELGAWRQKQGDLDGAAAVARKAVALAPGDWAARAALADYLTKAGKNAEAEQALREFITDNEGRPEAGQARDLLAGLYNRSGRTAETEKLFDQRLAANPDDRVALLRKAQLALSEKKPADAVAMLETLVAAQPDSAEGFTLLAVAYQELGRSDQVRGALEQAVRARPADLGLRRNLVQYLVQEKQPAEALAQASAALAAQPDSLDALNLKADALAANGRNDEVEALLKEIRTRFPDQPMAAFRLGSFYQDQKRYDAALAEYEFAAQKTRNALEPLRALVSVDIEQQQPAKAEARLRKVLAENPKHGGAYELLGLVQIRQNRSADAIKSLNKAIEVSPQWLPPYASLGALYEREHQPDRAIAVYRKALLAVPGDVAMSLNLARAFEANRQPDLAIAQYESLLQTHPDHLLATNNLAALLGASNDPARLKRALELAGRLEASTEPAFLDTLAWLHYLAGDPGRGRAIQIRVVERAPQVPVFQYHLGMMYAKSGDSAKAREHLAKALEQGTDFTESPAARQALQELH